MSIGLAESSGRKEAVDKITEVVRIPKVTCSDDIAYKGQQDNEKHLQETEDHPQERNRQSGQCTHQTWIFAV